MKGKEAKNISNWEENSKSQSTRNLLEERRQKVKESARASNLTFRMFISPDRWVIMNNFIQKFKSLANLGVNKPYAKNVFDDILF
mgnify:CR=1 FL=1